MRHLCSHLCNGNHCIILVHMRKRGNAELEKLGQPKKEKRGVMYIYTAEQDLIVL